MSYCTQYVPLRSAHFENVVEHQDIDALRTAADGIITVEYADDALTSSLSFRWRQAGVITVETRCHNPTQPLRGVMLEDYSSSDCVLTIRHASGHNLRLCACTGRDCNERMLLNKPSEDLELVISECRCDVPVVSCAKICYNIVYFSYHQVCICVHISI